MTPPQPPAGWTYPPAARRLLDAADTAGWNVRATWDTDGVVPVLTVRVHRDGPRGWDFRYTWEPTGSGVRMRITSGVRVSHTTGALVLAPAVTAARFAVLTNPVE